MKNNYSYQDYFDELLAHGDKVALVDGGNDDSLTYNQLIDLSRRLVAVLDNEGLKAGDRLVIIGVRGVDWVPIFFATQLAGIVAVPIDTRASSDLITAVIEKTKPKLIVKGSKVRFKTKVKTVTAKSLLTKAQKTNKSVSKTQSPKCLGQILLSSGTWSQPKGVSLKQSNLLQNMLAASQVYPLSSKEVLLSILPLSHAYEQMCGLHIPLRFGCKVIYLDEIDSEKIKALIKKHKVTLIVAVPRILELFKKGILSRVPAKDKKKFRRLLQILRLAPIPVRRKIFKKVHQGLGPSLKTLVVGGAALTPEVDNFFQGLGYKVLVGYGLSETSPIISILKRQGGRRPGEVGRKLGNIEAKVNEEGELLVRGPTVFAGYWPQKRSHLAWFNTGDLVEMSQNGSLRMLGRSKDMIVFNSGDKLLAGEVEDLIIQKIPAIEEVIVMATSNRAGMADGVHLAYRGTKKVDRQLKDLFSAHLPKSARVISISNIHPEFLSRTHTLKLARRDNQERFLK